MIALTRATQAVGLEIAAQLNGLADIAAEYSHHEDMNGEEILEALYGVLETLKASIPHHEERLDGINSIYTEAKEAQS